MFNISGRMEDRRTEILESIIGNVEETLAKRKFEPADASQIALSVAENIFELFGGHNITFPTNYKKKLTEKEALIFQKFDGTNYGALAKEHKMAERSIRKLISRVQIRNSQGAAA